MRTQTTILRLALLVFIAVASAAAAQAKEMAVIDGYGEMLQLHREWRAFEEPPRIDGVPDYTAATFARRHGELARIRQRLAAIDATRWPVEQRVDYEILHAEMNGFDFYVRVLKPWERDPAWYQVVWNEQSDTPAHEGPTIHCALEVWTYPLPLSREATAQFADWLDAEAPRKTGPSGIGRENYSWSLRHVHLVPMSWEQEVELLQRELARSHAALKLEEERNRGLAQLPVIQSPEEYERRGHEAVTRFLKFLSDRNLYPMRDNMDPALRAKIGSYTPIETRNFFAIATHYEPLTLYTHFYHWWDLARMRDEPHPSPVRRVPLLYNIWDSRAEGMATAMEEFMLHAGLYDDQPRAREIVWIMLAQRAARGLASLYAHDNQFDLAEAKAFQVKWTPRGWMRPDLDLLGFEQQLYLRQPGYGTSYVTGKQQLEDLIRVRADQLGAEFSMRRFFDEVNGAGMIPVSLIRWQLTGYDDEIRSLGSQSAR
jgi:hypothetical protein